MRDKEIKIGTRKSKLALWQAHWVKERLEKLAPTRFCKIVEITTTGDIHLEQPLAEIEDKGLFTKELELSLLSGKIDLAVHSLKDMPTILPQELILGAVCRREDPSDALVSRRGMELDSLPEGAVIGTSSLRRRAQLYHYRQDLRIVNLRGNVDTRLGKLVSENLDAIVLSYAGLCRLGLQGRVTQRLPRSVCLPAVGQGAIGVEIRAEDKDIADLLAKIDHAPSRAAVVAERALLNKLEGGCRIPIAALATVKNRHLSLEGLVASLDGKELLRSSGAGLVQDAAALGLQLAEKLLQMGAAELLQKIRQENCFDA